MKTRIFRSPTARYYAEDILEGPSVYTDECLEELHASGFTDVWLRARLRDASQTTVFPELGHRADEYREALNMLCRRAATHNIGVYLYFNEPLCFPSDDAFWLAHPEVRGASGSSGMDDWDSTYALCTSHPSGQTFLKDATADLFRHCPGLAGVFTITASEHHTHCYSHNVAGDTDCPRCTSRPVADVIAEVNNLILTGIRAAGSPAKVVAFAWGWSSTDPDGWRKVLEQLDPGVAMMSDFEIGGKKVILGEERAIREYSLSYVGPSEQFTAAAAAAARTGHEVFAKLQIGTTHEIATVNNLPLIPNLLGKARHLRESGASGALLCWNFGNRLTLNTWSFNHFLDDPDLPAKDDTEALTEIARGYLGDVDSTLVINAWSSFVEAFDYYPFDIAFLYSAPVNYALVYPLPRLGDEDRLLQWTWIPLRRPFGTRLVENVEYQHAPYVYSLDELIAAFQQMAKTFSVGLTQYRTALAASSETHVERELRNAEVIQHILLSTANIYAAFKLVHTEPFDEAAWRDIADDEAAHLTQLLPLLVGETEIGYHSEAAAWFFTAGGVQEKIDALDALRTAQNVGAVPL